MKQADVKLIQSLELDLGELIVRCVPHSKAEWDAFEKMVAAHKNLMKIDTDSLLQMELPLKEVEVAAPVPREDCPRCSGTGDFIDALAPDDDPRPCTCPFFEDVAWDTVKEEWAKEYIPAEVPSEL